MAPSTPISRRGVRTIGPSCFLLLLLLVQCYFAAASSAASSSYKVTHSFQATTGLGAGGSLVCDNGNSPSKQTCYGFTYLGGAWGVGTVFSVRGDGTRYRVIATFDIFNGGFPSAQVGKPYDSTTALCLCGD